MKKNLLAVVLALAGLLTTVAVAGNIYEGRDRSNVLRWFIDDATYKTHNLILNAPDLDGDLPAISGANLTSLNAGVLGTGILPDARLSANVTVQGNAFNGASQLVQMTAATKLPAVDGSLVTAINAGNIGTGVLSDSRLSANVTVKGNSFNGVSQLVETTAGGAYPALSGAAITGIDAGNIGTGVLSDSRLSSNVTAQGNTFNGASQLVKLTAGGILPVLDGSALTGVTATSISNDTTANICIKTCAAGGGKCLWMSTDEWDLFTSTGTGLVGQWRNTRTGIGACL